jgi:hypothetical protein
LYAEILNIELFRPGKCGASEVFELVNWFVAGFFFILNRKIIFSTQEVWGWKINRKFYCFILFFLKDTERPER